MFQNNLLLIQYMNIISISQTGLYVNKLQIVFMQMVQDQYNMVWKPTSIYLCNHYKWMGYNGTLIFHRVTVY